MKYGLRSRFALWLLVVLLPVTVIGWLTFERMENASFDQVADELVGVADLEATRIEAELETIRVRSWRLAATPLLVERLEVLAPGPGDQQSDRSLDDLAEQLLADVAGIDAEVGALRIVDRNGVAVGQGGGFDWIPDDEQIVDRAMERSSTLVGDAFRDADGNHRLGTVAAVVAPGGSVVGAVLVENDLGPIVDPLQDLVALGPSNEAFLVQRDPSNRPEYITRLRFEPGAAFSLVPDETDDTAVIALDERPDGVVEARDYRGLDSIVATTNVLPTDWGLAVKVGRDDALAAMADHRSTLATAGALGIVAVLAGWALLLDPVARRLRRLAAGAERVAAGEYGEPLNDRRADEIGSISSTLDALALALETDGAIRADIEERLRYQANHDATTGLFNRQYATNQMHEVVASGRDLAVLFMDLDRFKEINDTFGHAVGDGVLAAVGNRLDRIVGTRGAVARWGGDEFIVLIPDPPAGVAERLASRFAEAFEHPINIDSVNHRVGVSVGHATASAHQSVAELLHAADEAMFVHKTERRRRSGEDRRSTPTPSASIVERALSNDDVEVVFQPLISGGGNDLQLVGAEALVRLRSIDGRLLQPASFLHDLNNNQIAVRLDRDVIQKAVGQAATWIDAGLLPPDFSITVNCSESLLNDDSTPAFVAGVLSAHHLRPSNLTLDISEGSGSTDEAVMARLEATGIRIAVDDLGLARNSIERLFRGGASMAKIDGGLLRQSSGDRPEGSDHAVLRHLILLCESLGLEVVAEGVETMEHYAELQQLGVSMFQGHLFTRPLSGVDFAARFLSTSDASR